MALFRNIYSAPPKRRVHCADQVPVIALHLFKGYIILSLWYKIYSMWAMNRLQRTFYFSTLPQSKQFKRIQTYNPWQDIDCYKLTFYFRPFFCYNMISPICHRSRQHPGHKSHNSIRKPKNPTENKPNSPNYTHRTDHITPLDLQSLYRAYLYRTKRFSHLLLLGWCYFQKHP